MTVQQLGDQHRRYVDLSQRFRAAWVFHQFLQSLAKLCGEEGPPLSERFQGLYSELKACSQDLHAESAEILRARLDAIESGIEELTTTLRDEDTRWPPGELRRFFRRFKRYDVKILVQLVRFYLDACRDEGDWTADRKDKVDFLVTRLGEEERAGQGGAGHRFEEVLARLWQLAGAPMIPADQVAAVRQALGEVREELATVGDLEDLERRESLRNYRELKRGLGPLFFEPGVLAAILETNAAFRDAVERLYAREETRIAEEYQNVLAMEREVLTDAGLAPDLQEFHDDVESFERNLQQDELRLEDLARIRQKVKKLKPLLARPDAAASGAAAPAAGPAPEADPTPPAAPPSPLPVLMAHGPGTELLADPHRRLLEALGGVTQGVPANTVIHSPDLFPFQLEPREVLAYRKLQAPPEEEGDEQEVERFILEAAALRVCLVEAAEEARSLESTHSGFEPSRLRRLAALGDAFVRRFEHLEQASLLAGEDDLARILALLRVRLTREWAEAWLLAHENLRRLHR
jgi:hypothetical protein